MKERDKQKGEWGEKRKGEDHRINMIKIYDLLEINCYWENQQYA